MGGAGHGPTETDHVTAVRIATSIGRTLPGLRRQLVAEGVTGTDLGTAGDRFAQATLEHLLVDLNIADAVLSEEASDDRSRLSSTRVWVIDPLDGTREFTDPQRIDWAVHVALVINGEPSAAAVHLPEPDVVLSTSEPVPCPSLPTSRPLRIVVSRTRPPRLAPALATHLDAEIVTMGSAGAKAAEVMSGQAEIYLHDDGMNEWDACAPAAVAAAAGLHSSGLDGRPLAFNKPDPKIGSLLICHPDLADQVLEFMQTEIET